MSSERVFINRHDLHRLLVMGELMAALLNKMADELDRSSGANDHRPERTLPEGWNLQAMTVRRIINEPAGRLS